MSLDVAICERLLARVGRPLAPGARVLDLGCGESGIVDGFSDRGYDAWGCDFAGFLGEDPGPLRLAIEDPYRLPFAANHFDFAFSNEVLEHVLDHDATLAELARVLSPAGTSLHIFPPPLAPREQHVYVPLAGVLQGRAWLRLWATLGVKNEYQAEMAAGAVARQNELFLREQTNYLGRRRLLQVARRHFSEAHLVEGEYLAVRHGSEGRLPMLLLGRAYGGLRARVLFLADPL